MANWGNLEATGDVEDRRSMAPVALGGLGLTGVAVVLLFNFLSGGNLSDALNQLENVAPVQQQVIQNDQPEVQDGYKIFASTVLGSSNDLWNKVVSSSNQTYTPPKLVLFRTATQSSCGVASSEEGPHYCPLDQTIYLDETFFDELTNRFGAKGGDVAQAYVIAHEAGHHAQNELGIMDQEQSLIEDNPDQANVLSVKLELQADCFAGMWANSIKDKGVFEPGEINEAIDAAAAVGDDRIQKKVNGYVNRETWTHGSSEERVAWFNKGYDSGSLASCNTFK